MHFAVNDKFTNNFISGARPRNRRKIGEITTNEIKAFSDRQARKIAIVNPATKPFLRNRKNYF